MNLKIFIVVSILITSVTSEAQSTYVSPYSGANFTNQFSLNPYILNGIGPYGQQIEITQQLDFLGPSIGLGYSYLNNFNDLIYGGLSNYNQFQSPFSRPVQNFNQYSMFSNPGTFQQQFIQPLTTTLNQIMNREPAAVEDNISDGAADNSPQEDSSISVDKADRANKTRCELVRRVWRDGECKVEAGLSKDSCDKLPSTVWLNNDCREYPTSKDACIQYSDAVYFDWKCYNKADINKDDCARIPDVEWKNETCSKKEIVVLNNERGDCPMSEAEAGYKFDTKCGIISKEDCLDPNKHNGHSATWYHGSCWDICCEKDEMKTDSFCTASKKETENISSCSSKEGVWTEAKRDGTSWLEGSCANPAASGYNKIEKPSKDITPDSGTQGNFSLYITGDLDFLKSEKKTDGQYPKFNLLKSCLQNLNGLQDRNLQYSSDNEQFSFRDIKRGQSGVSFVENKTAFFVEEKELIKIREDFCKDEIKKAIQVSNLEKSKLSCSVNFSVGDSTYTVKFQKGNILANSPQYLITDSGDGGYDSDYSAPEQDVKKVNYKNLYLGIENAFKNLTAKLRENCPKDPKKFSSDAYIGNLLNFSGSCDGVLTTGWRDQDIDPKLEDDLKDAIKACRARTKIKTSNHENESTGISR